MKNKKLNFGNATTKEISALTYEAFKGLNVCNMSLIEIGKRFISYALEIKICQCNFDEVRKIYIDETKKNDVSENEGEFYKEIARYCYSLNKEPKDMMLKYFFKAKDDLKKNRYSIRVY